MASVRDSLPSFDSRLLAYSAAAGVVLAAAPTAKAQVVFTDVDPDVTVDDSSASFDLDGDGTDDLAFIQADITTGSGASRPIILAYGLDLDTRFIGYAGPFFNYGSALDEGGVIGPNGAFVATVETTNGGERDNARIFIASTYGSSGPYGPWADGGQTDKYLGVRFQRALGSTHYAWVKLTSAPSSSALTIQSFAFESTPDTDIVAGNEGAPPTATEPDALAVGYRFSPVAPNPVTGRSTFTVTVARTEHVRVDVVDAIGRTVRTLHDGALAGGAETEVAFDSAGLPMGVYVVRVVGESFDSTRTISVVR